MHPLWNQLQTFTVDKGHEQLSFSARLARENQWSLAYAEQVFQEYLRFLFLACVADHPVTPSEDVDQAWHLHLCYSKSYWKDLCQETLQRPLHHNPTAGGPSEGAKYRDQYQKTLDSYQSHFGQTPPSSIWPSVIQRFSPQDRFIRVNLRDSFVLPKRLVYTLIAVVASSFILTGCDEQFFEDAANGDIKNIFTIIVVAVIVIWILLKINKHGGGGNGCGSSCSADSGCSNGCGSGCGGCGGD